MTSPAASVWGTPALRKYLEARTSTATWSQPSGTSTSGISKTTEPSGLAMRARRRTKVNDAKGSPSEEVNRRVTVRGAADAGVVARFAVVRDLGREAGRGEDTGRAPGSTDGGLPGQP